MCGYIHEGTEPPPKCPCCQHSRAHFAPAALHYALPPGALGPGGARLDQQVQLVGQLQSADQLNADVADPPVVVLQPALQAVDHDGPFLAGKVAPLGLGQHRPNGHGAHVAVDRAHLDVDLKTLLSDKIVIEELIVEGPEFAYEMSLKGSNISKFLENLKRRKKDDAEEGVKAEPAEEQKEKSGGKKIQINLFRITDAKVRLQSDAVVLPMPDIELKNIGKESDGVSPAEAAAEIFSEVSSNIVNVVSNIGGALKKTGSGIIKGIKGIFSNDD